MTHDSHRTACIEAVIEQQGTWHLHFNGLYGLGTNVLQPVQVDMNMKLIFQPSLLDLESQEIRKVERRTFCMCSLNGPSTRRSTRRGKPTTKSNTGNTIGCWFKKDTIIILTQKIEPSPSVSSGAGREAACVAEKLPSVKWYCHRLHVGSVSNSEHPD